MHIRLLLASLVCATGSALSQSTPPPALDGQWKKQQLTDTFWAEGVAVTDVNKDGKMDVLYGPHWYAGPDFKTKTTIYADTEKSKVKLPDGKEMEIQGFKGAKTEENGYSQNFQSFTHDVNGDSWDDYVVVSFPGKFTYWYENPKGAEGLWKQHTAWPTTDNESPMFTDIDGDGRPDLLCMSEGHLGFASYDAKYPTNAWQWHQVSPRVNGWQKYTHGIGFGDVNGDGKTDLLEGSGWWEQPKAPQGNEPWKKHDAVFATKGGAQMYVLDVNADGKNDVISSLAAHEYGLAWFEQAADGWKQHLITGTPDQPGSTGLIFSQLHAIELADMNGDGLQDIVTGKRFWAHGMKGDPEPNAPAVVWWFELKREAGKVSWTPHLIDDQCGVGTQFVVADVDGDKKLDVVIGNKRGCFVLTRP